MCNKLCAADYRWTDKAAWEPSPREATQSSSARMPDPYNRPSITQYNSRITQLGAERSAL